MHAPIAAATRHRFPTFVRSSRLAVVLALSSQLVGCAARARHASIADETTVRRLQAALDSLRSTAHLPGATLGVALADGRTLALATGFSDTARRVPMRPSDRLLQGSVGKTYVAAVALQLVAEGRLRLDAPIAEYLGDAPWLSRLPNGTTTTVRQLMNHTSGLVRYEFQPAATAALRADPLREWTPLDRLQYVLDTKPPFASGEGWEYSDTNYIVLGMIVERITGRSYYGELRRRILEPFALRNTIPSDRPVLPGVVVGYAGPHNDLGGYDASIVNGRMAVNPQFEWTGGGIASTAEDLARWASLLYGGRVLDSTRMREMLTGVPARLGPNTQYGLGVIIRRTALGSAWGHSGFFPGYATEMLWFPDLRVAVAIQVNVTDPYPRGLVPFLVRAARIATEPPA